MQNFKSATQQYIAIYADLFDTPEEQRSHGCKGAIRKLRHRGKSRHTKSYDESAVRSGSATTLSSDQ